MNAAISIVGPYLPPTAKEKGIDTNIIGYVFA
jgi:TRAP-type C4-dicarboxylate transport system permease large subunit